MNGHNSGNAIMLKYKINIAMKHIILIQMEKS